MSMPVGSRFWRLLTCLGLLAAGGMVLAEPAAAAAPLPQDAQIQAHLQAGEFAPALNLARRAATREQRDAWLAQIALAQARVGARNASLRSIGEISDDRTRAQSLGRMSAEPVGGRGGGAQADFDTLIELITSTVQPSTWDAAGGPGSIAAFPTGVWVDAQGLLRPLVRHEIGKELAALRAASAIRGRWDNVRRSSPLRMVSLTRLEKQIQLGLAAGTPPTEAMQMLAGLRRIKYVFVYPETGDLVLAGPAGDWRIDGENHAVSPETGEPVLRLDDLVVVLRHMLGNSDAQFGCLITPRAEGLARMKAYVEETNKRAISPAQSKSWLDTLRSLVGKQDIEVYGLDARTRAARVMVEADYRMKLVGMGLEEGTPEVRSYLASIRIPPGGSPPPMGVLRWWFTLNYDAVVAESDHLAFEVRGQGVKVLSENEKLAADGSRVHTGQSEDLNAQFARSFTAHFGDLCQKYPIYAELRNIFDLALVGAMIRSEGLADRLGWHLTCFGDPQAYPVEFRAAPKEVDTVINHRVINQKHIVAGVSGGVACHPGPLVVRQALKRPDSADLQQCWAVSVPKPQKLPPEAWWWDKD